MLLSLSFSILVQLLLQLCIPFELHFWLRLLFSRLLLKGSLILTMLFLNCSVAINYRLLLHYCVLRMRLILKYFCEFLDLLYRLYSIFLPDVFNPLLCSLLYFNHTNFTTFFTISTILTLLSLFRFVRLASSHIKVFFRSLSVAFWDHGEHIVEEGQWTSLDVFWRVLYH